MKKQYAKKRRIVLLGATGTLGTKALNVIKKQKSKFDLVGLSAGKSYKKLEKLALQYHVHCIHIAKSISNKVLAENKLLIFQGENQWNSFFAQTRPDIVLNCISGAAGLPATIAAIESKSDVALANKESLVIAGRLVMKLAKKQKVKIIPVDSEHSAIFQLLSMVKRKEVSNIILTASGGNLLNKPIHSLSKTTIAEATKNPNWKMGSRITIDSSTMVNKAMEVVEAFHLFNFSEKNIKVLIHPQSLVHGMVELKNGSVLAYISKPDMSIPISVALNYPQISPHNAEMTINLSMNNLLFCNINQKRFPALSVGYNIVKNKGKKGVILNAADETAIQLFLKGEIKFTDIGKIVKLTIDSFKISLENNMAQIKRTDALARQRAMVFASKLKQKTKRSSKKGRRCS